jgi:hypothetical protein
LLRGGTIVKGGRVYKLRVIAHGRGRCGVRKISEFAWLSA